MSPQSYHEKRSTTLSELHLFQYIDPFILLVSSLLTRIFVLHYMFRVCILLPAAPRLDQDHCRFALYLSSLNSTTIILLQQNLIFVFAVKVKNMSYTCSWRTEATSIFLNAVWISVDFRATRFECNEKIVFMVSRLFLRTCREWMNERKQAALSKPTLERTVFIFCFSLHTFRWISVINLGY